MTNHHEEPAPLPALVWAVVFTILLVAAVAVFASLVASGVTNAQPAAPSTSFKRLPGWIVFWHVSFPL